MTTILRALGFYGPNPIISARDLDRIDCSGRETIWTVDLTRTFRPDAKGRKVAVERFEAGGRNEVTIEA